MERGDEWKCQAYPDKECKMKLLYFDCGMGAAGDMLSAALLDCLKEPCAFVDKFNLWVFPALKWRSKKSKRVESMAAVFISLFMDRKRPALIRGRIIMRTAMGIVMGLCPCINTGDLTKSCR